MDRRQILGALLVALLVIVNLSVWFYLHPPPDKPYDNRAMLRNQRTSEWKRMETESFDEVADLLAQTLEPNDQPEIYEKGIVIRRAVSFHTLEREEKKDLLQAIGGAVEAVAANDPLELIAYMEDRATRAS